MGAGPGGWDWQPADADMRTAATISHEAVRLSLLACAGVIFQIIFFGFLVDSTRLESVNSRRNRSAVTVRAQGTTALYAQLVCVKFKKCFTTNTRSP